MVDENVTCTVLTVVSVFVDVNVDVMVLVPMTHQLIRKSMCCDSNDLCSSLLRYENLPEL